MLAILLTIAFCAGALLAQDPGALGLKALETEKYAEAADLLEKAIAADPQDLGSQFNLALARTFLNQHPAAIAGYRRTLALKPGLYEASLNLGMVLLRDKQPAEAVQPLKDAAAAKPKESRPRLYLAEALAASGANSEAAYREVLTLDAKSAAAQLGLGRTVAEREVAIKKEREALLSTEDKKEKAEAEKKSGETERKGRKIPTLRKKGEVPPP